MQPPVASSRALIASAGLIAAIVVAATAIACGSDDSVVPKDPTFVTTMTGAGEVPATTSAGTGTAIIVKKTDGTYTYTITYSGMSGALIGGHIHGPGAAGVIAPIIVPFANATGAAASATLTGTFTSTNTATISNDSLDVLMRTGNAYVNLHTNLNKGGEIRGQLSPQQ